MSLILAPAAADAATAWTITDTSKQDRPTTVDFTGAFWAFGSTTFFGGAGWFCYPVVPEGFLPTLNDSFYIEGGAYTFYYQVNVAHDASYSYLGIIPAGGVRWDFHLTRDWTAFATAKLGFLFPVGDDGTAGIAGGGSVGAYWKFSPGMYLRLETGNLGIIAAGVSILL